MKFSIIIPFKTWNLYVEESVNHCLEQTEKDFEIILLPDVEIDKKFPKTKIFPTGPIKPSLKRNLGVEKSKGEILAFIDDDAYPDKDWLKNSIKYLQDESVGAVGGPNLTPPSDSILQKASGDILASPLTGRSSIRYKIGKNPEQVLELPSCNLLVKKEIFLQTNKFDPELLTAEDSELCFEINNLKKKVLYVPDVIVYHHRRKLFKPHLKQMYVYGRDIAWLIKNKFSIDKLYYSILSLFVIYLVIGLILSFFNSYIKLFYIYSLSTYLIITAIASFKQNKTHSLLIFSGLVLTHIVYGVGFLYGLLSRKEKSLTQLDMRNRHLLKNEN